MLPIRHLPHTLARLGSRVVAIAALVGAVLVGLAGAGAAVAAPPAGSFIDNRASASYFDTDRGFHSTLMSNTVRLVVQPVEALTLTPVHQIIRPAGATLSLPHRLANTGNLRSSYSLNVANLAGDGFDALRLRLVVDLDGNGVADAGEPPLADGASVTVDAGAAIDLVISGVVPTSLASGAAARIELSATSAIQSRTARVTDVVTVGEAASVQLTKVASNTTPRPGERVEFTLTARNTGNRVAAGVPLQVDGTAATLVLMRDVIPANLRFVALGPAGAALALYHLQGTPEQTYQSQPPADLSRVDAVAFGFASLASGQSVESSVTLAVQANASGAVVNIARMVFSADAGAAATSVESNPARLAVPIVPPVVAYYSDASYGTSVRVARLGQPAYVQAVAAQCNTDPQRAESRQIIISSALGGDSETFLAIETGPNTGMFRIEPFVITRDAASAPVVAGDGVLSVRKDDRLLATLPGCGSVEVSADLLIDPFGVVFDSRTDAPLAGATVTLIDVSGAGNGGAAGAQAHVFSADGLTRVPSQVTTDAAGHYEFPLVKSGIYRLHVQPPGAYGFPSLLAPALMPAGRVIDAAGSYGASFPVSLATGAVQLDIPLDAGATSGLFLDKTASRRTVELGEFVDYTIKLKNTSGRLIGGLRIEDQLPAGFAYVRDSARLNGGSARLNASRLPEPEGGVGPRLVFNVGSLEDAQELVLSYRVRIGPLALQGDGINRATAFSAGPLVQRSNLASVALQVLPGVFDPRGFVIGTVFADCNRNALQDGNEPGVPGVRLFLQDGSNVVTDGQGRYSLYGVRAQTHVLKLDKTSLPAGSQLALNGIRQAGDAGSRFVDLAKHELHRADFALDACDDPLLREIGMRARASAGGIDAAELLGARFAAAGTEPVGADVRGLPAAGTVGRAATAPYPATTHAAPSQAVTSGVRPSAADAIATPAAAIPAVATPREPDDPRFATFDHWLAIVSPTDGQMLAARQTPISVKGAIGSRFELSVNGVPVPEQRVGKRSQLLSRGVQVWDYIGVDLRAGLNQIEIVEFGADGKRLGEQRASVRASGPLARIELTSPLQAPVADGKTPVPVVLTLSDDYGAPVGARTPVTLNAGSGAWLLEDLNRDEPGTQIFVEGGRVELALRAPTESGRLQIDALAGDQRARLELNFVPELRAMIAAGLVEGALNLRHMNAGALMPAHAADGFEQELRSFAASGRGNESGRAQAGARAALFLKGKLRGDYLLTLAYDSDKATKDKLFRDIAPDEYYPVYGDQSGKGFDAQSTGKLYVRVDRGSSFVLYGDFATTAPASPGPLAPRLAHVARSLSGVKLHDENKFGQLDAFASRAASTQVVDELPARGVSGPYGLTRLPYVQNSERVEVLTRHRDQASRIVKTTLLARFADYEIEPLTGSIILKAALPTFDVDLNPNTLRVSYEVEQGGDRFWVGGVAAEAPVGEALKIGAAVVQDRNPLDALRVAGAHASLRMGPRTEALIEAAASRSADGDSPLAGIAQRAEIRHDGGSLQAQASVVRADAAFKNPSAGVAAGRIEANARAALKLDETNVLRGELLHTQDAGAAGGTRDGAALVLEHSINSHLRAEVGARTSHAGAVAAPAAAASQPAPGVPASQFTSLRGKLAGQWPEQEALGLYGEYEQDVGDSERRIAALGADYRLAAGGRLYARHEFISSLGSHFELNSTQRRNVSVFGIDAGAFGSGQVFSEYRLQDSLGGREAEAALGLRNTWQLGGGLALQGGFERIDALSGAGGNQSVAVNGGLEYTGSKRWKGSVRLDLRSSAATDSALGSVGLAVKLDDEWTLLGREAFSVTHQPGVSRRVQQRLQVGLAFRDVASGRWNGLARVEHRLERADELTGRSERAAITLAAHAHHQPRARLDFSTHGASKWARDSGAGIASRYDVHLLGGRAAYEFVTDWELGAKLYTQFSGGLRSRHNGVGLELGHAVARNLWLTLGANQFSARDADLIDSFYTQSGLFLRMRFKFDEESF